MNYVTQHWSYDPLLVVVLLTVMAHEIGLARLSQRSKIERQHARRVRALAFYAGLAGVLVSVESPIDYWSSQYFFVHMCEHVLLMFFSPALIVFGAPWIPLMFALPVTWRRRVGRALLIGPVSSVLRPLGHFVRNRWFAVLTLNAAMIVWHIPAAFDYAEQNQFAHVWLMHASFIVTGVLFWLQIIPSRPLRQNAGTHWQAGAVIATNIVMFLLAMSLSIFSSHGWYASYRHVPGVTLSSFADQQIGAAILWVCGDFWAIPALIFIVRRMIDQDASLSTVMDRALGRRDDLDVAAIQRGRQRTVARESSVEAESPAPFETTTGTT